MKIIIWLCFAISICYIVTCSFVSYSKTNGYELIQLGYSDKEVIRIMGNPSFEETPAMPFSRYSSVPCDRSCQKRLWFENGLSFHIEAWSIELDSNNQVISKARWLSP